MQQPPFTQSQAQSESSDPILTCQVCDGTEFRKMFTKKTRHFYQCVNCGYQCQHPLPTLEELADYYEQSYQKGMYKLFAEEHTMKVLTAQQRFKEIAPYCQKGNWLDVGCANGFFVGKLGEEGMQAEGIDVSANAVERAREQGWDCQVSTVEEFDPNYRFQNVTGFDIIEHVRDPEGFLNNLFRLTKPGGTVVVSTPNVNSFTRKLMGARWYFYIPEEHLNYFNPETLQQLMEKAGFTVVKKAKTYKPLTFNYSLEQFKEYNPLIHRILSVAGAMLPNSLKSKPVRLYIGEMKLVATKPT